MKDDAFTLLVKKKLQEKFPVVEEINEETLTEISEAVVNAVNEIDSQTFVDFKRHEEARGQRSVAFGINYKSSFQKKVRAIKNLLQDTREAVTKTMDKSKELIPQLSESEFTTTLQKFATRQADNIKNALEMIEESQESRDFRRWCKIMSDKLFDIKMSTESTDRNRSDLELFKGQLLQLQALSSKTTHDMMQIKALEEQIKNLEVFIAHLHDTFQISFCSGKKIPLKQYNRYTRDARGNEVGDWGFAALSSARGVPDVTSQIELLSNRRSTTRTGEAVIHLNDIIDFAWFQKPQCLFVDFGCGFYATKDLHPIITTDADMRRVLREGNAAAIAELKEAELGGGIKKSKKQYKKNANKKNTSKRKIIKETKKQRNKETKKQRNKEIKK